MSLVLNEKVTNYINWRHGTLNDDYEIFNTIIIEKIGTTLTLTEYEYSLYLQIVLKQV